MTRAPDIRDHNPDPEHIRSLLERAGLTQQQGADLCGVSLRTMQGYVAEPSAPYPVQYLLECAGGSRG